MSEPLTYEDLKALAEELDRPLGTLYALTSEADPFMAGRETRAERAEWFGDLWRRFKLQPGAHLRRIHYVLISQSAPVLMPNGEPYENTENCWTNVLTRAVRDARYLGLIKLRDISDRRNDEAHIHYDDETADAEISVEGGFNAYVAPSLTLPELKFTAPKIPQRYMVEIWCEKSTMNDVLMPLGERYGVNVVTGVGELSLTRCVELVDRAVARADGLPVRILYISDFDPSGASMPVAVARKIEFVLRSEYHDVDIQVRPVVLTHDQCVQYRLPRTPIKDSDKRAGNFEARFGAGATELDALEALHPGELARILEAEIERYYDDTLDDQIEEISADVQRDLDAITDEVHERHADAIKELKAEHKKAVAAIKAFEKKAKPLLREIQKDLSDQVPDCNDYDWPDPSDFEGDEDDDPLYDSSRDYVEQIDRYKEHQDKATERVTYERVCVECGATFEAKSCDTKFCSKKCVRKANYRQSRAS
jgi:hypothetical protein